MDASHSIEERLAQVRRQINDACARYGRDPASARLLAVSKTKPLADIIEAMACGQRDFGENYLQEAIDKIERSDGATWHFIGAIQSNKTTPIATHFDWVHTLASGKHARRLSEARPPERGPLNVLLQVNIANEDTKAGLAASAVREVAETVLGYPNLALRGLMAIPRPEQDFDAQRAQFRALAELREETASALGLTGFNELSMGMSADLEAAIAEGSTWLRVGTAIFGARQT